MNKITIVHVGNFLEYPPVISLIENLKKKNLKLDVISNTDEKMIPSKLKERALIRYIDVPFSIDGKLQDKVNRFLFGKRKLEEVVNQSMKDSDILWTTTDTTVKLLGKTVLKYKHVMQLMELIERYPLFLHSKKFDAPIDLYAQKAYKVVVPSLDRAYIQQTWWDLEKVPSVLPNKPYSLTLPENNIPSNTLEALEKMKKERRKIILYSGVITPERNIGDFANAIDTKKDFCIYVMGKAFGDGKYLKRFLSEHPNVEYIGYHVAPAHLLFFKYAYIGLTPYIPTETTLHPKLNAQYCAPNKIYEYSAFGVPMLGTNVIGLVRPFEQYKIGRCAEDMSKESILRSLNYIDDHHDEMSVNAIQFFNKDNLDEIVRNILENE